MGLYIYALDATRAGGDCENMRSAKNIYYPRETMVRKAPLTVSTIILPQVPPASYHRRPALAPRLFIPR